MIYVESTGIMDTWANRHPCRQQHTILKVMEYARSTEHRKLLQSLEQGDEQGVFLILSKPFSLFSLSGRSVCVCVDG